MDVEIEVALIKNFDKPEIFYAKINEENFAIARKKIEIEIKKIQDYFLFLKNQGKVKSDRKPICSKFNQKLQNRIDNLMEIKKKLKNSRNKLIQFFGKI